MVTVVPGLPSIDHVLGHVDRAADRAGCAAGYSPTFAKYSASVTGSIQVA